MKGTTLESTRKPRVMHIATSALSMILMRGQLRFLTDRGFQVAVVSSPGSQLGEVAKNEGVEVFPVPICREISFAEDLVSLWRLIGVMKRWRPEIVNVSTPKAGLLGSIAARLAGVPCRVYTLRGLRSETGGAGKKLMLRTLERIACGLSHQVICVSSSLRQKAVDTCIVKAAKACVLAGGSSNGVDALSFAPTPELAARASHLRNSLGIPTGSSVVGFVGRCVRDKGIVELVEAFDCLRKMRPALCLLLVGDFEDGDPIAAEVRSRIKNNPNVIITGFVPNTAAYYQLMDVLALPTYREGFPNVVLEAQAAGVPVVTTYATGAVESVLPERTGLLVPLKDKDALAAALARLLGDLELRRRMGAEGVGWVTSNFRPEAIWEALLQKYNALLLASQSRQFGWRRRLKVIFDRVAAALALIVFSPLMAITAFAIFMELGSPVIFRQPRPGLRGSVFTLLKFRTMTEETDASGGLLPDKYRLRRAGKLIRSLSLDELPQLWNVLCGHMSLVGPRPLLLEYLDRYTPEQLCRHDVLPGITGWTQINGRNRLTWEEKFDMDRWYIQNWSLTLDFKILLKTISQVVTRKGIAQDGFATMPEFLGTRAASSGNKS